MLFRSRAGRAARRAELAAWAAAHVTDLLFIPVITVPAVLAWTAMAAYGAHLYGPAGRALPAFSEGAMWVFAAATTIRERDNRRRAQQGAPPRPVWHLRLGIAVFAIFGAVLNFAHGLADFGATAGIVMALVSAAGVTAHQIVTAGPRRSRADRDTARIEQARRRRLLAARKAAVRHAVAELDADGNARLVFWPDIPAPADTGTTPDTQPDITPDIEPDTAQHAGRTPQRTRRLDTTPRAKRASAPGNAARIARLHARHPQMPATQIASRLGISERTVRRHLPDRRDSTPAQA